MRIPARLGLVTLGVADLDRSVAFYQALGWEQASSSIDGVIQWFRTADTNLGLFPIRIWPTTRRSHRRSGARSGASRWRSTWTGPRTSMPPSQRRSRPVARSSSPGTDAPFGRSGYFADPDGYPWEVAFNRDFPIGEDGRLRSRSDRSPRDRPVSCGGERPSPSPTGSCAPAGASRLDRTPGVVHCARPGGYLPEYREVRGGRRHPGHVPASRPRCGDHDAAASADGRRRRDPVQRHHGAAGGRGRPRPDRARRRTRGRRAHPHARRRPEAPSARAGSRRASRAGCDPAAAQGVGGAPAGVRRERRSRWRATWSKAARRGRTSARRR
jgi:hypothetical protein